MADLFCLCLTTFWRRILHYIKQCKRHWYKTFIFCCFVLLIKIWKIVLQDCKKFLNWHTYLPNKGLKTLYAISVFSYTCCKSLVQDGILVTLLNWSSDSLWYWAMKSPHPTTFQKKLIIYRGCALRDNTCKVNENLPSYLNRITLYLSKKINKWKKYHIYHLHVCSFRNT